ncbi:MAG: FkbM family methyltransferase, partial [Acidobacteriota bacterium]
GANVGYYAAHFARLVGSAGQVICLEANPVCAYFLRANLIDLGLDQARILPAAALHVNGMTRFSVNYGNTNLGTAETSGFFHHKPGQEIAVGCFSLDHLIADFGLPAPDFLKIDVEGAELQVLEGMERTLQDHRPTFLLELHGAACTQGAISILAGRGYRFENPATRDVYETVDAAREAFAADSVYQVVARPPR